MRVIDDTDFNEVCDPQTGDCVNVAVAISEIFDHDGFVTIEDDNGIQHVAVSIGGELYDSNGITSSRVMRTISDGEIKERKDIKSSNLYDEDTKEKIKTMIEENLID